MSNNEISALFELRAAIDAVKAKAQTSISTEALSQYVEGLIEERSASHSRTTHEAEYAGARAKFAHDMEVWKIHAPLKTARDLEMFKSVIEAGGSALKAAMLVNGGAAIALLAFLGNAFSRQNLPELNVELTLLNSAMLTFFIGTWLAAMAYGLRYLSQLFYAESWEKFGIGAHIASIALGFFSFCLFLWGGLIAHSGF